MKLVCVKGHLYNYKLKMSKIIFLNMDHSSHVVYESKKKKKTFIFL